MRKVNNRKAEWTESIDLKAATEKELGLSTGLTKVDAVLTEVDGSQTVFGGFNTAKWAQRQYFIWNSITESCYRITKPVGKEKIIQQIKKDFSKVEVQEYGKEVSKADSKEENS